MGDASSVRVAVAEESTFGSNPGSGFEFQRFTNDSLKGSQQNVTSAEIDPTRQPAGTQRTNFFAEGALSYEMSLVTPAATPNGFDRLAEGAMMNDWSTLVQLTSQEIDISNISGGTFDLDDQHVSADAFADVVVGQWMEPKNFDTNTTIYARVTAKASDASVSCEGIRSSGAAVTAEAGQLDIAINASMLRIGTTKKSYSIEKQFTDLTPSLEYMLFTGMRVGTWSMGLTPQQLFTGEFGFTGKLVDTTTSSGAGSVDPKWSTTRLQAVDHFKNKMEGSFETESALRISEISFNLNNGVRTEPELGIQGSTDIGISTPVFDGTLTAYMTDAALQRKLEDNTSSKLAWRLTDGTRSWLFSIPLIRFTDASVLATGNDQSVLVQMQWSAEPDANGLGPQIDRF